MATERPLDQTGTSPSNYIVDELHTVSESHFRDFQFIVMNHSPFYVDRFKMVLIVNGVSRELVEDVDYSFALSYVTGTRVTGKNIYGAVTLHNLELNGLLKVSYQTVGGTQTLDRMAVLTDLADRAYNPRTTIWDIISGAPESFPPTPHYQDYKSFYGQEELVQSLGEIRDAILTNSSLTKEEIKKFLQSLNTFQLEGVVKKADDPEAVTKSYVDSKFISTEALASVLSNYMSAVDTQAGLDRRLPLTGGVMTGPIVLNAPPQQDMNPANKGYVDSEVRAIREELDKFSTDLNDSTVTQENIGLATTGVTPGSYTKVTVDGYGRVLTASNPTTLSGYNISDAQPLNLNLTNLSNVNTLGLLVRDGTNNISTRKLVVSGVGLSIANEAGSSASDIAITSNATSVATADTVVSRNANGNFSANVITAALVGNASSATTLQNSRYFSISGDVVATAQSFNGAGNVTLNTSLTETGVAAGTYTKVEVDAKGRVISATAPTSIADLLINDVYTKQEVQAIVSELEKKIAELHLYVIGRI